MPFEVIAERGAAKAASRLGAWMLKLGISHPIAPFTNPINSPYDSTALNSERDSRAGCGHCAFTFSGLPAEVGRRRAGGRGCPRASRLAGSASPCR